MMLYLAMLRERLSQPALIRLLIYLLVTVTLVMCGVVYFNELPRGDVTAPVLTPQLRDAYEGYTIYLGRATGLLGLTVGLYAASIARGRGMGFGLAMLLTVHLSNIILFMIALPPIRAGEHEFLAGLYYHAGAALPAALVWLVVTAYQQWSKELITGEGKSRLALPKPSDNE